MKRTEFLNTLGIGLAAACTGCLAACGKDKGSEPAVGGIKPPAPSTGVNFNIDLNTQLTAVGQSLTQSGVIVVRTAAGNSSSAFTAVQVTCTHEGTMIGFNSSQGNFVCPNHGSVFSTSGAVITGPATSSLKTYNRVVTGSTLTVTG